MLGLYPAMVGADEPALQQGHYPVHSGQHPRALRRIFPDHRDAVTIPLDRQWHVPLPALRMHLAPRLYVVLDKCHQAVRREVGNVAQARPTELRAQILLGWGNMMQVDKPLMLIRGPHGSYPLATIRELALSARHRSP